MSNSKEPRYQEIAVIGAGLVGCLATLGLAKRGYKVTLFELRPDPRDASTSTANKNLRSINLAVSDRGLNALNHVDPALKDRILEKVIPMTGRMIHKVNGEQESQRYDVDGIKGINSIDRSYLNELLLDEVEAEGIKVKFNHKLNTVEVNDQDKVVLKFQGQEESPDFDFIIGSDGSFSKVRAELQKFIRMDYSQEYIDCAYLELSIPPGKDDNNKFLLDRNHLHIWPRDDFMLIALPNLNGSFTSTFFGPWELLESLTTDEQVLEFFEKYFPDAIELIGRESLLFAFANHPKGKLLSLKCSSYNYKDKILIIGDAAHAMVPFYGQGMNCGFEDVFVLLSLLEKHQDDASKTFKEYSETRHKDLVAIIDLAVANYREMSHKVNSKIFLIKKNIDFLLSKLLRDKWLPLYTMVSFRSDVKYSDAIAIARRQEKILNWLQATVVLVGGLGALKLWRWFKK